MWMFKWFKTVRVLICTAESPHVLLHGLHALQLEYLHWWWWGLIVPPDEDVATTFVSPQFLKHRSKCSIDWGQGRPPPCGCCCLLVGEKDYEWKSAFIMSMLWSLTITDLNFLRNPSPHVALHGSCFQWVTLQSTFSLTSP